MVTGGTSVGIPVHLGIGQVGDDDIGTVHNDLVSSADGVVQALSRGSIARLPRSAKVAST